MRRMKYLQWGLCGAALVSLAGCGEATFAVGEEEANLNAAEDEITISNAISANAISANAISANAISANAISANAISANAISANAISANAISANSLLPNAVVNNSYIMSALNDPSTSPDPRYPNMGRLNEEFLRYAYSCAMPAGTSMTLTLNRGNVTLQGGIGLAPEWATGVCDLTCQRWVSACLIARVNGYHVPIDISLRGTHPALATTPDELNEFPRFEGRFWGNVFTNEFSSNFNSCFGNGGTLGQQTSRICAQTGGNCNIRSVGECNLTQCDPNGNCKATPFGGGTSVYVPSIEVYLKNPDPAWCGDGACEAGETPVTCSYDCATTSATADHEEDSTKYVRTLAAAPLDANVVFYAGITNATQIVGLPVQPTNPAGTEDTYVIKAQANSNGSYTFLDSIRVAAGGEDPVAMELDETNSRVIVANTYSLRSFSSETVDLQWTRQESTTTDRFRFESITVDAEHVHALGYAQTYNGTSWTQTGREYRKYDVATGQRLSVDVVAGNHAWQQWTAGGCYSIAVRNYSSSAIEVRGNALNGNTDCSAATDWVRQLDVPNISTPIPVAVGPSVIVGTNTAKTRSFIARYFDGSTDFAWVNTLSAPSGRAIRIDEMMTWGQNVLVAGQFKGPVDFRGSIPSSLSARRPGVNANEDVFVAAYDLATGELRWVRTYGGPGIDDVSAFTVDKSSRLWVFGDFVGTPMIEGKFVQGMSGDTGSDGMMITVGPLPMGKMGKHQVSSAMATHSLLVRNTGQVFGWGPNSQGQLCMGTTSSAESVPVKLSGIARVVAASVGDEFSLLLRGDGEVLSCGSDVWGRLGNGSSVGSSSSPTSVVNLDNAVAVSAGKNHALALKADGTVCAWGSNASGQLGTGSTPGSSNSPICLPSFGNGIVDVLALSDSSLALDITGRVYAWGNNSSGQLGQGTTTNQTTPTLVTRLSKIVQIAGGTKHALAITSRGELYAWGDNTHGQVGVGTTSITTLSTPQKVLEGDAIDIAAGARSSIAMVRGGSVRVWGSNDYGQLGFSTATTGFSSPTILPSLHGVAAVAAGSEQSFVMNLANGEGLVSFGRNQNGALGNGKLWNIAFTPTTVLIPQVRAMGGGAGFALALQVDGSVWATGKNDAGELANGRVGNTAMKRRQMGAVPGLTSVAKLSAGGGNFALALLENGTVRAWGTNTYGQLGDGTTTSRTTAVGVVNMTNAKEIAIGSEHSLVVKQDGTVWSFGRNNHGQLGDGTTATRSTAVQVSGLTNIQAVAAGASHSLALDTNGSVWAWGRNTNGQLGNGTTTSRTTPVQLSGVSNVIAIAAGKFFSMALDINGKVWTWGLNNDGQLGIGSTTNQSSPVEVQDLTSPVIGIAAGDAHALVLLSNGRVQAWGLNGAGQIGNDTVLTQATPVTVLGLDGVASIQAAGNQSMAVRLDGTFWVWGDNQFGQLGDHSETARHLPVQILEL